MDRQGEIEYIPEESDLNHIYPQNILTPIKTTCRKYNTPHHIPNVHGSYSFDGHAILKQGYLKI
jgi:hypothetical protein